MKYSWKGHKDGNRHKNRIKRSGQAGLVHVKTKAATSPPCEGESMGTIPEGGSNLPEGSHAYMCHYLQYT